MALSYVPSEAFSPAADDTNILVEKITLDGQCLSLCACVCLCVCAHVHSVFQNDDRITTHSEPCSGNRGPRQRMRERCNIFIRQEQAPLAKNEFVRLLDRPSRTDSTRAELDSAISEQGEEKKVGSLFRAEPRGCTWDREQKGTDNQ